MDLRELHKMLENGLAMFMATRDSRLTPVISEVMGLDLSPDGKHMVFYVSQSESQVALENIAQNDRVAVTMARPANYFSAQIKGVVRNTRPITKQEIQRSKEWSEKYKQEIKYIGTHPQIPAALVMQADTAIEAEVQNLYLQTPGPEAGRKLEFE